ncbi:hypothetical protein ABKN59_008866 [Abortiporus biennis]
MTATYLARVAQKSFFYSKKPLKNVSLSQSISELTVLTLFITNEDQIDPSAYFRPQQNLFFLKKSPTRPTSTPLLPFITLESGNLGQSCQFHNLTVLSNKNTARRQNNAHDLFSNATHPWIAVSLIAHIRTDVPSNGALLLSLRRDHVSGFESVSRFSPNGIKLDHPSNWRPCIAMYSQASPWLVGCKLLFGTCACFDGITLPPCYKRWRTQPCVDSDQESLCPKTEYSVQFCHQSDVISPRLSKLTYTSYIIVQGSSLEYSSITTGRSVGARLLSIFGHMPGRRHISICNITETTPFVFAASKSSVIAKEKLSIRYTSLIPMVSTCLVFVSPPRAFTAVWAYSTPQRYTLPPFAIGSSEGSPPHHTTSGESVVLGGELAFQPEGLACYLSSSHPRGGSYLTLAWTYKLTQNFACKTRSCYLVSHLRFTPQLQLLAEECLCTRLTVA